MPKIIEYPRASFSRSMQMADAINYLGGECTFESCAERMGVKVSGGFTAVIGSGKKHDLVDSKKETLTTTETYKRIKLSYTEEEKRDTLRMAFLSPPLYRKIFEKFKGKDLPISMLDRLLIREYGVEKDMASRVAGYFVDGARECEILDNDKLIDFEMTPDSHSKALDEINPESREIMHFNNIGQIHNEQKLEVGNFENYTIHIQGPGMNSKLTISETEDFLILDAMISKLKKRMKAID
jgi:hypothetical protein